LGDKPHGFGDKPHGLGDKPHGLGDKPHGFGDKPHGLGDFFYPNHTVWEILLCIIIQFFRKFLVKYF